MSDRSGSEERDRREASEDSRDERDSRDEKAEEEKPRARDDDDDDKKDDRRDDDRRDDDRRDDDRRDDDRRDDDRRDDDRRGDKKRDVDVDADEVTRRCEERQKLRRARDFAKADQIRADLEAMGVELDDKRGEWEAKTGQRGTYTINSGHGGEARRTTRPVDEREVDRLCQDRQDAKNDRAYRDADRIRDELLEMGVSLDDGRCEWECRGTRQRGRWERWGPGGRGGRRGGGRDIDRRGGGRDYGRDRDYDRRRDYDSRDRYDRRSRRHDSRDRDDDRRRRRSRHSSDY